MGEKRGGPTSVMLEEREWRKEENLSSMSKGITRTSLKPIPVTINE